MKLFLSLLVAGFAFTFSATASGQNYKALIEKVNKLTNEQKNQAALDLVNSEINNMTNPMDQARVIIKALQLEMSLHGYETAVKKMKARAWPKDPKARVLLNAYYARALQNYAIQYSWEIRQREKTVSTESKDLKTWTAQEIYHEAYRSYADAFKLREFLGTLKKDEFKEFVYPNNFPNGLKDTFRDSLSYLFVQLLNDSGGWSPAETNDLFELNLQKLALGKTGPVDLTSEKHHPLLKISFILEDLRASNEQKGKLQGALESKLTLYRILYARFTKTQDRDFIRAELTQLLNGSIANPWYSMAAATLAEFWQQESVPDAINKALSFAQKGAQRFPASLGAARCRDIIKGIKLPTLQLLSMKVDGTEKLSLGLKYKNAKKVYFRSYAYDIKEYLKNGKDYNLVPNWNVFSKLLAKQPNYTWQTELEETTDHREHWHFVIPPKHENGFYITVASLQENFRKNENIVVGTMMTYGPLVLAVKNNYEKGVFEMETINGPDGKMLPDIKVEFYRRDYQKGHQFISSQKSDAKGRVEFKAPGSSNPSYFFIAESKGAVSFSEFYLGGAAQEPTANVRSVIYSDRSIYRPLQKIQWKAVFYQAEKSPGKFNVVPNHNTSVSLQDMNGQEIQKLKVKTDAFGAAWGEFTIPTGRALGQWHIIAGQDSKPIRVEEYKRPTFELSWPVQKTAVRLNRPAEVIGEAKYYFGQGLNKGKVKYKVQKSAILPWWCFWGYFDFSYLQRVQIVENGETTVQPDGRFIIGFTPTEDSRTDNKIEGIKYNYTISADVTDEGGETRSTQTSVIVASSSVEASWSAVSMVAEHSDAEIALSRRLISGGPAPGKGQWELVSLKEPERTLMPAEIKAPGYLKGLDNLGLMLPGDLLQPRWNPQFNWQTIARDWKEKAQIKSGSLVANEKGEGLLKLPRLNAGAYRLLYKTKDEFGESVQTQIEFFVASPTYRPQLPLLFFADQTSAKVGETVRLWLPTGLKNQTLIFEVFQDSKLLERRYLNSDSDSGLIEWPIKEEHRGGLGFSVRLLNDYQALRFSQSIFVPWDNKEITIETKTFRDRLIPGQKEKWTFVLKGPKGAKLSKASSQLLAYMYDRSLDALAPHSSPSMLSLYPYRYGVAPAEYQLGQGWQAYFDHQFHTSYEFNRPIDDRLDFYSSYGIGGPGQRGRGGYPSEMMEASGGMRMKSMAAAPAVAMADSANLEKESDDRPAQESQKAKKSAVAEEARPQNDEPAPEKTLRSNFSEAAFFLPTLYNSENGEVQVSFEIPDSVTSWNLWLQAFTKDVMAGTLNKQVQTVKDLMARPYLPRFLREADIGQIKVVVNNTSDKTLKGFLDIELSDETQKENVAAKFGLATDKLKAIPFKIEPQKSFDYVVEMKVPAEVGIINFKAVAKTDQLSDGELRPLPILPGRFHLAQSRFVTLNNKERREMNFPELAVPNDPSRISEKMVVQVDAQLFYSVLSALPYLVNSPYECIEQLLNRFVSTGILTSVFNKYPAIDKMAKKMSARKTRLESFEQPDPNRKMAMEETPWLMQSRGGTEKPDELINVLDSSIARHTRIDSLSKLEKSQTAIGGFPWFSGGPPSPYITLYVLYGFSKALEFGVEVPKPMIQKAWGYLHQHYLNEIVHHCIVRNGCWETITFLNYVLSNYPDETYGNNIFTKAERAQMLSFSFKHWRQHSPYLKGYLALTLHRDKQTANAKLVWDSVMDSAKYVKDEGTHWAREDRSWLWYNDTVETHAFALRTLLELNSDNAKRDGLVEWLFLNKKLNHWKSTRATSEVVYSLAQYLTKTDQLGKKEAVSIKIGSEKPLNLEFFPDEYTGKKNQIVIEGEKVKPALMPVVIEKETPGLMFASTTWHFSTEKLPAKAEGDFLNVDRKFFLRETVGKEVVLKPLSEGHTVQVGDEVEVQLSIRTKHPVEYVHLRDPRGAGFEPTSVNSQHKWDLGIYWYEEIRDSGTNFFFEHLPQGEYTFKYRIRATTAGQFQVSPATLQPMYAPEFAAYSSGQRLGIK